MAQTGNFTPIQLYSSSTVGNAPAAGNLTNNSLGSELAINIADGKLFYKDSSNAIQVIAWKTTPTTAGGTGLTSYTAGDTVYYASGTTLSKLAIGTSNYIMTSSGTAPQWTDPTTVAVTSISFGTTGLTPSIATKGAVTVAGTLVVGNGGTGLTSLTAGYIPYGNGTSAFSSSSSLYFSGSNLGVGTSSPNQLLQLYTSNGTGGQLQITNSATGGTATDGMLLGYNASNDVIFTNQEATALQIGNTQNREVVIKTNSTDRVWVHGSGGVSIGSTTDPGAGSLLVNSGLLVNSSAFAYTDNKASVKGGSLFSQKTANVSTSTALVISGVAGVFVIRDNNVGGTAVVLLDAVTGVTILGQQGSIFTTSAPSATQIQLGITSSPNYGMTATAGSTRNGDQINIGSLICQ